MRPERPPEEWLFKAWNNDVMIDLIFHPAGLDMTDEVFERVSKQFQGKDLADLNFAVVAINAWNRVAIPFRAPPGSYQPPRHE